MSDLNKIKDFLSDIEIPLREESQITEETVDELTNGKGDDDE